MGWGAGEIRGEAESSKHSDGNAENQKKRKPRGRFRKQERRGGTAGGREEERERTRRSAGDGPHPLERSDR